MSTKSVSRAFPPRTMGVMGTILFHVLMVQTIVLGSRAPKLRLPEELGPGATLINASTEPEEALVLVQVLNTVSDRQALFEDLASAGSAAKNPLITTINPDPLPQIQIPKDEVGESTDVLATVDSGDPASRARLFGIYTGQIEARINRAWRRPRSSIVTKAPENSPQPARSVTDRDSDFECQIKILQDARGYVQEVQMLDCNGDVRWQQSLVAAVLSASPLPAPPSPTVFTHSLTMTFSAHEFAAGSAPDGYEIPTRPVEPSGKMKQESAMTSVLSRPLGRGTNAITSSSDAGVASEASPVSAIDVSEPP